MVIPLAYNLFIAYDLNQPGQNYDAVRDRIKSLGRWHQFQYSLFYVSTGMDTRSAYDAVWAVMDPSDKLIVIDANGGVVSNSPPPLTELINSIWYQP